MQYSSQRPQPNQFGTYGQNQNIGTTQSEQMMLSGMGGLPQMMQADHNVGQFQYQGGSGGGQSFGGGFTTPQYGQTTGHFGTQHGGYQQTSNYGTSNWGTNQNIGTTPTEQMMRSGMGGLPQVMQADRNVGYYGPSQSQYQGGQQFTGSSYGMPQYGQTTSHYGSQYGGYQQSSQYGTSGWGTNQNIGTTPTEQMMQSGMGGLSQVMQADRNIGYQQGMSQRSGTSSYGGQQGNDC